LSSEHAEDLKIAPDRTNGKNSTDNCTDRLLKQVNAFAQAGRILLRRCPFPRRQRVGMIGRRRATPGFAGIDGSAVGPVVIGIAIGPADELPGFFLGRFVAIGFGGSRYDAAHHAYRTTPLPA
jgi:hypothetical protein